MTFYVTDQGANLKKQEQNLVVKSPDETLTTIALDKLDNIVLVGCANTTSPLVVELLKRGIPLTFLSSTGEFYGNLEASKGKNIERLRHQFRCADDVNFCLNLAKQFIMAKIKNCQNLLLYYQNIKINAVQDELESYINKVGKGESINQIIGYEGNAAKLYFKSLGMLTRGDFQFVERTKQPPRDRFNSLLSFGYHLLTNEMYTVIVSKALQPYCAFLHQIRKGHPTLASDLIEEWRPLIADSLVMEVVKTNQFKSTDFIINPNTSGVYLNNEASKNFIALFNKKMLSRNRVITRYPLTFRESLHHQVALLVTAIENRNPEIYKAIGL